MLHLHPPSNESIPPTYWQRLHTTPCSFSGIHHLVLLSQLRFHSHSQYQRMAALWIYKRFLIHDKSAGVPGDPVICIVQRIVGVLFFLIFQFVPEQNIWLIALIPLCHYCTRHKCGIIGFVFFISYSLFQESFDSSYKKRQAFISLPFLTCHGRLPFSQHHM